MDEPLTIAQFSRLISKHRFSFILTIILALLIAIIVTILLPKTYESTAILKMGTYEKTEIISAPEAEQIMQSPLIIQPLLTRYYPDSISAEQFLTKNLIIELIRKETGFRKITVLPFLSITARSDTPERAHNLTLDAIDAFMLYANAEYSLKKKEYLDDYDYKKTAIEDATSDYDYLIAKTSKEIDSLNDQIKLLSKAEPVVSAQDIIALRTLLENKQTELTDLMVAKAELELKLASLESIHSQRLLNLKNFTVLGISKIPDKPISPNFFKIFIAALIFGIALACLIIIRREVRLNRTDNNTTNKYRKNSTSVK